MLAYKNDKFIPMEQCHLTVYDLGVLVGAGVTDLARTFNGRPWMLGEHVTRLLKSCKYACIKHDKTKSHIMDIVGELVKANYKDKDLGIVFYVTPGENPIYAGNAGLKESERTPTFIIHTFPLQTKLLWNKYFEQGIHLVTTHVRHIPPNVFDQRIKHRNRLHMWMAERQTSIPGSITMYLDERGFVTETGGANIAAQVHPGIISTPRENRLDGCGMATLKEAAKKNGMLMQFYNMTLYDLLNAREVYLTTTPYCLAPVCWINNQDIGNGQPGPMWRKLLDTISDMVGKDIYKEMVE